jgi:hypothetical protein
MAGVWGRGGALFTPENPSLCMATLHTHGCIAIKAYQYLINKHKLYISRENHNNNTHKIVAKHIAMSFAKEQCKCTLTSRLEQSDESVTKKLKMAQEQHAHAKSKTSGVSVRGHPSVSLLPLSSPTLHLFICTPPHHLCTIFKDHTHSRRLLSPMVR